MQTSWSSADLRGSRQATAEDIAAVAVALVALLVTDGALHMLGYARTVALYDRLVRSPRSAGANYDVGRFARVHLAVDRAGRRYRRGGACLRRALLLGTWLRYGGTDAAVRLGARMTKSGGLTGHAWLEVDGLPIAETIGVPDQYVVFR